MIENHETVIVSHTFEKKRKIKKKEFQETSIKCDNCRKDLTTCNDMSTIWSDRGKNEKKKNKKKTEDGEIWLNLENYFTDWPL